MAIPQNDPTELLEVYDASGKPTGEARTRSAIHLAGDWHLAFHCWVLRHDRTQVVLQRRSLGKDTFAGLWDASAAGHWRFGESAAEAAREIEEELGLDDISFDSLHYVGRERNERSFPNGLTDREHHAVYVLDDDRPLSGYRPDVREVIGLAAFDAAQLVELADGIRSSTQALEAVSVASDGTVESTTVSLTRQDMVPYSAARLRRTLGMPLSR